MNKYHKKKKKKKNRPRNIRDSNSMKLTERSCQFFYHILQKAMYTKFWFY